MTAMEQVKKFRSTLEVLVAIIGCMVYLNVWWGDMVVSKKEFLMATNEIRMGQVESELRAYQRAGLDTLNEQERHQYDLLVKAQDKLTCERDILLGLSEQC